MEKRSERNSILDRFTATKERSWGFRLVVIFLVLIISVFMILRFAHHMIG